jgi:hypothetical protein
MSSSFDDDNDDGLVTQRAPSHSIAIPVPTNRDTKNHEDEDKSKGAADESLVEKPIPMPIQHSGQVQFELQVEVIAASRLRNLEEKNNSMSSPFVRCSILRNYLRHKKTSTFKKYNLQNNSSSSNSNSNTMNLSSISNIPSSSPNTLSHKDPTIYNPINLYEYFDTCTISNNLSPIWRIKKHSDIKNNNYGTFKIGGSNCPFWGLALQIDVLSHGNKLLGTVTIDLFEWDETSCNRKSLTSWFPLHLQHRTDFAGSIALSIHRREIVEMFKSTNEEKLLAETL